MSSHCPAKAEYTNNASSNSDHLNNLKPHVDSGLWVFGGASLDEPIKEGEPPKINGSVMLAVADTKEEVMKSVKEDVYFKSGVWDESKVSFYLKSLAKIHSSLHGNSCDDILAIRLFCHLIASKIDMTVLHSNVQLAIPCWIGLPTFANVRTQIQIFPFKSAIREQLPKA